MPEDDKEPDPKQSQSGKAGETPPESPWIGLLKSTIGQLIPLVLTGASLIGFVAFAGAVIVWTRFDAIGVPPDQAVRAVPRSELVATGSSLLLLFGFFGVLAVLATYLVDRRGRATPGMSRILLLVVAVEGVIAIVLTDDISAMLRLGLIIGFLVLIGIAVVSTFDSNFVSYVDELPAREKETVDPVLGPDALHMADGELRIAIWKPNSIICIAGAFAALVALLVVQDPPGLLWWGVLLAAIFAGQALLSAILLAWWEIEESRKAEEAEAEKKKKEEEEKWFGLYQPVRNWIKEHIRPPAKEESPRSKEAKRTRRPRPHRLVLRFWGVCLLLILAVATIVATAVSVGQWWLAASLAAAYVLATGVWRVSVLSKTTFTWYGLAVFISVPLFGTCTLMARNVAAPQVQPMALIRTTDGPSEAIQGIYVTEGSDRVYFASVATEGCQNKLTPDSGRLQWVPKSELVAMSVGPLQDVDKAGKAALEMSDALTPSIETPTGEQVSPSTALEPRTEEIEEGKEKTPGGELPVAPEAATGGSESEEEDEDEGEEEEAAPEKEEATPLDHRLTSAGPAIRPNFGTGLKLVPPVAEPGDVVELRMSAPNTDNGVDGFGEAREGFDLRLNGVRLAVLRVPVQNPRQAEYVKTVGGRVLPVAAYFEVTEEGSQGVKSTTGFVRLDNESVHSVTDANAKKRGNFSVELDSHGKLAPLPAKKGAEDGEEEPPSVILPNGEEEQLESVLLRRSWSSTKIKFRVPRNARRGVVSVECGQLGGQPVLDVVHPPVARIAVRVRPGTERLTFDSRQSADQGEAVPKLVWRVGGRRLGGKDMVSTELPPRLAPYEVSLTISDAGGLSDRVELRVWRLPSSIFSGASARRAKRLEYRLRVRDALEEAIGEEGPADIELDGHADLGTGDVGHSLTEAERLRRLLFAPHEAHLEEADDGGTGGTEAGAQAAQKPKAPDAKPLLNGGAAVPLLLRAFGQSCPIVRHPGPQSINDRVEVFLLGPGATVGTGKHCHAARSRRAYW